MLLLHDLGLLLLRELVRARHRGLLLDDRVRVRPRRRVLRLLLLRAAGRAEERRLLRRVVRGLVARVVPAAELLDDAVKTAGKIAAQSQPIVAMAKDLVNASFESSLAEGLRLERSLFYSTFSTADQKIGMNAFMAKEKPAFKDE